MKRTELLFGSLLVPIDFAALVLAGAVAYWFRTSSYVQGLRPAQFVLELPLIEYLQLVVIVSVGVMVIFALQGLYAMSVTRRLLDEFGRLFSSISVGFMAVIMYIFLSAELFQSRFILLAAYIFAILFVFSGRITVRRIQQMMLQRGLGAHRVILVGNGRYAQYLADHFTRKPRLGYRLVATLDSVDLGRMDELYKKFGIDEVIKTDPAMPEEKTLALLEFCDTYKIDYKYIPDLYETYAVKLRFQQLGGVPLMELLRTPLDGWGRVAKRIMDLFGSILGLVLLAPLFLIVAFFIKLDTKGPVFYRQTRVGRNRKEFEIFKFRSMHLKFSTGDRYGGKEAQKLDEKLRSQANERSGPLFKMKNDPRITKVGHVLRRTRIDELPQLFNVLKGDMSLMGPRPHLPKEVEGYSKHHRKLFTIKPGMTGMAQVNGNAGLPFEEEAKLDIGYIEDWSLRLDVVLLLKTLKILFTDRNAV